MKRLNLNPNEMAVRMIYWPLVEKKEIFTFFRPGVRLAINYRGYCEQQEITLRCIDRLGYDQLNLAPELSKTKKSEATVYKIYSKRIKDLNEKDFLGSSPDVKSIIDLKFHLGLIYNLSLDDLNDDSHVTIVKIKYKNKNNMKNPKKRIENIIQNGMWKIAEMPPNNPQDLEAKEIMLTLINHDYPARTPLLWNHAFKHFKINAKSIVIVPCSENLDKESLKWTFSVYRDDERFLAGGLGVGFKDESIELLDILDESSSNVGAANFVCKNEEGKLVGYNTDGLGFVGGLQENFPELQDLKNKNILILGSGGTANAIAFALAKEKAKLIIVNRTKSKAISLAEEIQKFYKNSIVVALGEDEVKEKVLEDLDLVVNASIKGAEGSLKDYSAMTSTDKGLINNLTESMELLKKLPKKCIVSDVVLKSKDTAIISQAKIIGLKTMNGLPMVVSQAAIAFSLSYGKKLGINFSDVYKTMKEVI